MVMNEDRWIEREKELIVMVGQLEHDNAIAAETIENLRHLVDTLEGRIEEKERDIRTLERHVDYWQSMTHV